MQNCLQLVDKLSTNATYRSSNSMSWSLNVHTMLNIAGLKIYFIEILQHMCVHCTASEFTNSLHLNQTQ